LKKLAGREKRFMRDVNHCIAKEIAAKPFAVFALEDLKNIRVQKRRGKNFDRKLNSWAFFQLEQFLRYKTEAQGKSVILVDSRFTSQKCSRCGHTYKGNRKGNDYRCRNCGFHSHADRNAALNIAHAGISCLGRVVVKGPNVVGVHHVSPSDKRPNLLGGT
jgi:IS605 OrfB family transposase